MTRRPRRPTPTRVRCSPQGSGGRRNSGRQTLKLRSSSVSSTWPPLASALELEDPSLALGAEEFAVELLVSVVQGEQEPPPPPPADTIAEADAVDPGSAAPPAGAPTSPRRSCQPCSAPVQGSSRPGGWARDAAPRRPRGGPVRPRGGCSGTGARTGARRGAAARTGRLRRPDRGARDAVVPGGGAPGPAGGRDRGHPGPPRRCRHGQQRVAVAVLDAQAASRSRWPRPGPPHRRHRPRSPTPPNPSRHPPPSATSSRSPWWSWPSAASVRSSSCAAACAAADHPGTRP